MNPRTFPLHRLRRPIAWVALLAVLLQLAASLAAGLHTSRSLAAGAEMVEVCTSAGIVRMALDTDGAPASDHVPAAQHCPFCASAGAGVAPLAVALFLLLPPAEALPLPAAPLRETLPATPDLRHAPPRGPPLLAA